MKAFAKGTCLECGRFQIFDPAEMQVWFNPRPQLPVARCFCPHCGVVIENDITFKWAYLFAMKGVKIKHTYDKSDDLQPIESDEIEEFLQNFEKELEYFFEE